MAEKIQLSKIRLDGGTQSRANMNEDTVAEYVAAMEDGAHFPPVIVFYDGEKYWLADGYHRYFATRQKAAKTGLTDYLAYIECEVQQGTQRDAVLYSVGANATHGLRRTNADKRRAVETLLRDEEWAKWSNKEISRRCGVDDKTVASVRSNLSSEIPQIAREEITVSRNGSSYTLRRPATQYQPHWSENASDCGRFWERVDRNNLYRPTILRKLQPGAKKLTDLKLTLQEAEHQLNQISIEEHSAVWKRGEYVKHVTGRYGQVSVCAPDYLLVINLSVGMEQAWSYRDCQPATRDEWVASVSQQAEAQPPAPAPETEPEPEQVEEDCLVPVEEVEELRVHPELFPDFTRLCLADFEADELVEIAPALARVLAYCEGYDVPVDDDLSVAAWQVFRFFDQVIEMVDADQEQQAAYD